MNEVRQFHITTCLTKDREVEHQTTNGRKGSKHNQ
ncbi:Uncharacterised protein [Vibrio cholerae]|nr:Uncharacterised protein [Vibrio cholerae]